MNRPHPSAAGATPVGPDPGTADAEVDDAMVVGGDRWLVSGTRVVGVVGGSEVTAATDVTGMVGSVTVDIALLADVPPPHAAKTVANPASFTRSRKGCGIIHPMFHYRQHVPAYMPLHYCLESRPTGCCVDLH